MNFYYFLNFISHWDWALTPFFILISANFAPIATGATSGFLATAWTGLATGITTAGTVWLALIVDKAAETTPADAFG